MTYNTPSSTEKYCKNTEPKSCQTAQLKCFLSFFFRWASSNLHDSFTMVFAQNSNKKAEKWLVKFNVSMCKVMNVTLKRKKIVSPLYHLSREHLEEVCKYKYLGVTITHNLTWSELTLFCQSDNSQ